MARLSPRRSLVLLIGVSFFFLFVCLHQRELLWAQSSQLVPPREHNPIPAPDSSSDGSQTVSEVSLYYVHSCMKMFYSFRVWCSKYHHTKGVKYMIDKMSNWIKSEWTTFQIMMHRLLTHLLISIIFNLLTWTVL